MNWFQALILGLLQGLTEFLPVSSSGHLELGKVLFNVNAEESLTFTVVVHGATVLSTIVVFRREILQMIMGLFRFKWNEETQDIAKIAISMLPVGFVGVFFKDEVAALFNGNLLLVGCMLLFTAMLLAFTAKAKPRDKTISFRDAFIIGIAQSIAVLPGISRSGSTIATGLLLGNQKEKVARFSFLMVLIPIIGANLLDLFKGDLSNGNGVGTMPLMVGFVAAFVSGWLACSWMINLVKKGKLVYFALYCVLIGMLAILLNYLG